MVSSQARQGLFYLHQLPSLVCCLEGTPYIRHEKQDKEAEEHLVEGEGAAQWPAIEDDQPERQDLQIDDATL